MNADLKTGVARVLKEWWGTQGKMMVGDTR
jgi:hypothetical protein